MKTFKLLAAPLIALIFLVNISDAQVKSTATTTTKSAKNTFPNVSISAYGGAIFPLPKTLNQTFKPGGTVGVDLGYRINREVGLYGTFGYYFMSSKVTGAPIGSYLEFSGGPRYYFTHRKLKSSLFFEGGVGAYNFRQNSYSDPNDPNGVIQQIDNTRAGINGGMGATLGISKEVDLMVKGKYNVIFVPNGSSSFINVVGGVTFTLR